jgi:deoxyribodipyrimidine photo-lyase
MTQLNTTGFMHNRARMIVASFLTKDLHVDWRWGEQYFATKLVDYDAMSNSGGWQWSAGCGTDAQPWFRIFNPWTQSEKFDPECEYIKKWIPVLITVPSRDIHRWYDKSNEYIQSGIKYIHPIVKHDVQREITLQMQSS